MVRFTIHPPAVRQVPITAIAAAEVRTAAAHLRAAALFVQLCNPRLCGELAQLARELRELATLVPAPESAGDRAAVQGTGDA